MTTIHPSHSKKELCEIVEIFDLKVADYRKLNKKNLSKQVLYHLNQVDEIEPDNQFFFVNNKQELLNYLLNPDCSKTLTIKEQNNVKELAHHIISYCKCGFYLTHSPFLDHSDMIEKAKYIAQYGDMPCVRRAIEMLNKDPKLKTKIEVIMSEIMKKKLQRKKKLKQNTMGGLKVKEGPFLIEFN